MRAKRPGANGNRGETTRYPLPGNCKGYTLSSNFQFCSHFLIRLFNKFFNYKVLALFRKKEGCNSINSTLINTRV